MGTSILSKVTSGVVKRPHYILLHGMPGLGKTTFASKAPSPIFLCAEKGTSHLDVSRLELSTFSEFMAAIEELTASEHKYETVVIDTVDHVEPLIFKEVCKEKGKDSIEDIGYAKGYIYALDYWNKFITALENLRDKRNMNVILLAHTDIKTHNDPQLTEPYDRYVVKLHHKAANLLIDRVENVLFANYFTHVEEKNGKNKAYGDGSRLLFTEHRPAFQAKNRFELPFQLPLEWDDFVRAASIQRCKDPVSVKAIIAQLLKEVKDDVVRKKSEEYLLKVGDDPKKLVALENKLKTIVSA
jgi:hypothetical protein